MLDELADEKVDQYLTENPKLIALFEVDVVQAVTSYVINQEEELTELDHEVIRELRQAHEALEKEPAVSQRVKASMLEEVNLETIEEP